ncbi:MAG TPA: hypothetical protein VN214_11060 [Pseudomonas sp.]|nr:hypothetical protein [Pseudomonas sp.]
MKIAPTSSPPSRLHETARSASTSRPDHLAINMEGIENLRAMGGAVLQNLAERDTGLDSDNVKTLMEMADQELTSVISNIPIDRATNDLILTIGHLIDGDIDAAKSTAEPETLANELVIEIEQSDVNETPESATSTKMQRALSILNTLGDLLAKLGRNEFESDMGRWGSNLTLSCVRTGLISATLTVFRQITGFFLESRLLANATPVQTRSLVTILNLTIGSVQNVLGALRDEYKGTANVETRLARAGALFLSVAALILAATAPQALPLLASYSTQMAFYSYATDLVNLFLPITDNAKASTKGTAASGLLNGFLQYLGFTGMNYSAPHSGPGYAMSQGSEPPTNESETFTFQLLKWVENSIGSLTSREGSPDIPMLALNLEHDIRRGAINGLTDVVGQVAGGELMHYFQKEPTEGGFRLKVSAQIPKREQTLNQFLSTNAIRTSVLESLIALVICSTKYLSTLPISKEVVDQIVNALAGAFFVASRFSGVYVNERTTPA